MGTTTTDLLPLGKTLPVASGFDYARLGDAAANLAKGIVERYRGRVRSCGIAAGRDLLILRERLDQGLFLEWVQTELRITPRSARRAMIAAEVLASKSETVSYLPLAILYTLAAPSTPAPVRETIIGRIEAGEVLSPQQIVRLVYGARVKVRQEQIEAKLKPEERCRQANLKRDAEARRQRDHENWQREQDEQMARKRAAAAELAAILAPLLDDDTYSRVYELIHDVDTSEMRRALCEVYISTAKDQPGPASMSAG